MVDSLFFLSEHCVEVILHGIPFGKCCIMYTVLKDSPLDPCHLEQICRTSLVAQWLRICLH